MRAAHAHRAGSLGHVILQTLAGRQNGRVGFPFFRGKAFSDLLRLFAVVHHSIEPARRLVVFSSLFGKAPR